MNCKNLILTIFKDINSSGKAEQYLKEAQESFQLLNKEGEHYCKVVLWKEFVNEVLTNP